MAHTEYCFSSEGDVICAPGCTHNREEAQAAAHKKLVEERDAARNCRCDARCSLCRERDAKVAAALDAAEARAREAEEGRELALSEAAAARATIHNDTAIFKADLADLSRRRLAERAEVERDRDAAQARVRRLEAALRYCDKKLSDANAAHPSFYVLDALNIIDAALADGADKGGDEP